MRRLPLVLTALIALILSGCGSGSDDEPSDGPSSAAETSALAPVVAAVKAATFSDLVVRGRSETAAERQAQATRCTAIGAALSQVQALAKSAYQDVVVPALTEVSHYCTWYGKSLESSDQQQKLAAALGAATVQRGKADTYLVVTGTDGRGREMRSSTCQDANGCIPGESRRPAWLAAYKAVKIDYSRTASALNGGVSTPCRLKDLQPLCDAIREYGPTGIAGSQKVYDTVKTVLSVYDSTLLTAALSAARVADSKAVSEQKAIVRAIDPTVDLDDPASLGALEDKLLKGYEQAAAMAPVPS